MMIQISIIRSVQRESELQHFEKSIMSQLYLPPTERDRYKNQISDFVLIYRKKLRPVFEEIEKEAEDEANNHYNSKMRSTNTEDFYCADEIAENAIGRGDALFQTLRLGKYTLTAAWHATLYELFEQQLRKFLYTEMNGSCSIKFPEFCTNLRNIKKVFCTHNVKVSLFPCWGKIEELKTLCNVIKHGDGNSAKNLRELNPSLFIVNNNVDYMTSYKTTLLKETLQIDENTLQEYVKALLSFWDELPERSNSDYDGK
ncbi:MAG: hypothetical protein GC154_07580 [bacterium]|nr:hypothetical protein [bacterium]